MSEALSPVEESGKADIAEVASEAYDAIAERDGLDDYGDEIPDEDEPLLEADDSEEYEDDEPIEASDDDPEPVAEEPVQAASGETLPPHTWPADWKESFNNLPAEFKPAILDMNQKMNAGFTKKMTDLAGHKRTVMAMENSVKPHQERLARAGIAPETAIQRSLAWDAHIQRNPQQGIMDMAKAYGVDLTQVTQPGQQDQYLTPTERALKQQAAQANAGLQKVQNQMQQWQRVQQRRDYNNRQQGASNMLHEFMNATDEAGNPTHPYIEHVAGDMTWLIENGRANDLQTAYNMAERLNDDVMAAKQRAANTTNIKDARSKVKKVRRASSGIVERSSGRGRRKAPKSTSQRVAEAYDQLTNAS